MGAANKVIIAVDEDVDPKDPEIVMWALSYAMQPHRDVHVVTGRVPLLDPSAYSLMTRAEDRSFPPPVGCSGLLVDATRKGPYPPVGLPKRQFMERALKIWQEEKLRPLKLKAPWFGYPLGLWDAEHEEWAEKAIGGNYFRGGQKS
jgi:4-hydroxy-3-polyprenylbenzoate decarboxylase